MSLTLYRRPGSSIWHYRGTIGTFNKRRIRGSCRTTDKNLALRIASEEESRAWKADIDGPASVLTFADAAHHYLDARKPTRFIAKIAAHWRDTPIKQITAGGIRASCLKLYPKAGHATWNRAVIVPTQAIINHAATMELCQRIKVPRYPVATKRKEPVTRAWLDAFMRSSSAHLGALACFMYYTGARITEALAVTWEDVNLERRLCQIRQTKGRAPSERLAHLPEPLLLALVAIPAPRAGRVFRYTQRGGAKHSWNVTCRKAGIKQLSFHCCRHGFATGLLRSKVDVVTVAKLGGWASAAHVLSTYGHAMEDLTLTDRLIGTHETHSLGAEAKKTDRSAA